MTRVIGTKIAPAAEHLDDQAEDARGLVVGAQRDDDVAHLADLVAVGVEDQQPGEARDEHACRGSAHASRLPVSPLILGEAGGTVVSAGAPR